MKYEPSEKKGMTTVIPETADEEAAVGYIREHVPIFAGLEGGIIAGYLAGLVHEREETAAQLRELAAKWIAQAHHPQRAQRPEERALLEKCAEQLTAELGIRAWLSVKGS